MKYFVLLLLLLTLGCGSYDLQSRKDRRKFSKLRSSKTLFIAIQEQHIARTIIFRSNHHFEIFQSRKNNRGKYTKDKFYFGLYENSDTQIILRSHGSADGLYLDTLKWSNQKKNLIFKDIELFRVNYGRK
ncbi:MAG TPA: hypothetical protein PKX92_14385 [Edaphocola sp.]|nr:hypothetical protein [Candidatus Dojkabacteria bacterium]HRP91212.1 hypothetical protein [Edaphocola sp.]